VKRELNGWQRNSGGKEKKKNIDSRNALEMYPEGGEKSAKMQGEKIEDKESSQPT